MIRLADGRVLLSIPEAAKEYGIGVVRMYQIARMKNCPLMRISNQNLVIQNEFSSWIEGIDFTQLRRNNEPYYYQRTFSLKNRMEKVKGYGKFGKRNHLRVKKEA